MNKIYGKHVLGEDIRGSVDSLAKINSKTLAELKNQFILSNNCVLGLSGVVDFDLAKMTFSKLKRGDTVPFPLALKITGIKANNSSFKIISKEQTLYRIVFQTAALGHEDTIYLNLLASYFNGLGGPLFQLREMTGEAYQIDCKHLSKRTHGLFIFTFMLGYHSDKNQKWIINTIYSMLKKVNKNKLKDNEITRALESYKGRIWTSMQNLDEQLLQLCRFELIGRGYEFFEKENSFSTEKIKYLKERLVEVVNKYFTDHLLVGVGAKKSEQI